MNSVSELYIDIGHDIETSSTIVPQGCAETLPWSKLLIICFHLIEYHVCFIFLFSVTSKL